MKVSSVMGLVFSLSLALGGCGDSNSSSQSSTQGTSSSAATSAPVVTDGVAVRLAPEPSPPAPGTEGPGVPQPNLWAIPGAPDTAPLPDGVFSATVPYESSALRNAYLFPGIPNKGQGEIIAIADAYGSPTLVADVAAFCSATNITPCNLVQVGNLTQAQWDAAVTSSKDSSPADARTKDNWALETSLDVQWAHAISPQATILLYVSPTPDVLYNYVGPAIRQKLSVTVNGTVSTASVHQFSGSFGGAEFTNEANYDSLFYGANCTSFVSSGDVGGTLSWPAAGQNVTAVGGTTLNLNSSTGTITSEVAWSSGGGGLSVYENITAAQAQVPEVVGVVGGQRGIPDIAYDSDPNTGVKVYCNCTTTYNGVQWFTLGGTSAAAPQWAAFMARVNCGRAYAVPAKNPIQNFNSILYQMYLSQKTAGQPTGLNDITMGSNTHSATVGYDLATGLGTPQALTLYNYLVNTVP